MLLQRGALNAADSAGALSEVAGWMRIIRPLSDWIPSHSLLLLRDAHGTLPWVSQHPWDWLPPLIQGWWASQPISSEKMPPGSPDNVSWCLKYISEHWQMSELSWRRPEPQYEAGMLRLLQLNRVCWSGGSSLPDWGIRRRSPSSLSAVVCLYISLHRVQHIFVYEASWEKDWWLEGPALCTELLCRKIKEVGRSVYWWGLGHCIEELKDCNQCQRPHVFVYTSRWQSPLMESVMEAPADMWVGMRSLSPSYTP